jgi:hypothetical protein
MQFGPEQTSAPVQQPADTICGTARTWLGSLPRSRSIDGQLTGHASVALYTFIKDCTAACPPKKAAQLEHLIRQLLLQPQRNCSGQG